MRTRNDWGSNAVEFPVALFIFLIVMVFPLIDLASLFVGASAVVNAARVAASQAARQPDYTSAENKAMDVASGLSTNGTKITPDHVDVVFLRTALDGSGAETLAPPVEPDKVDRTKYIYQIQVTVTGRVTPLVVLSTSLLGEIKGVTVPLVITTGSTATFENPKGLSD
jgi:Flp pilus assembly protein TadG